eukprot:SAG11_NODE_1562_length_4676_cov_2.366616_2_plen_102_part_00
MSCGPEHGLLSIRCYSFDAVVSFLYYGLVSLIVFRTLTHRVSPTEIACYFLVQQDWEANECVKLVAAARAFAPKLTSISYHAAIDGNKRCAAQRSASSCTA